MRLMQTGVRLRCRGIWCSVVARLCAPWPVHPRARHVSSTVSPTHARNQRSDMLMVYRCSRGWFGDCHNKNLGNAQQKNVAPGLYQHPSHHGHARQEPCTPECVSDSAWNLTQKHSSTPHRLCLLRVRFQEHGRCKPNVARRMDGRKRGNEADLRGTALVGTASDPGSIWNTIQPLDIVHKAHNTSLKSVAANSLKDEEEETAPDETDSCDWAPTKPALSRVT